MHQANDSPPFNLAEQGLREAIAQIHASPHQLVLEFAGAGSLALFWLHSVAGSSRTILEATDRYAPASLADLIGSARESFVSRATAVAMAGQAYRRAMRLADHSHCLGVACTAAIATDRVRRGEHRCWVAVRASDSLTTYGLTLIKGTRDRLAEERVVSQLLLHAIGVACGIDANIPVDITSEESIAHSREAAGDPLARLLAGEVAWVVAQPDGQLIAGEPVQGAILSGSFNPLHAGHERLAQAAGAALGRPIVFELPVVNADKPPLSYAEAERRLAQFRWRYPVALSNAPLFSQKAALFPGCVFVVGYDTAARLVEPRYYGGAVERDAAFESIRAHGCRFLVAGRAQDGVFHTLEDISIPAGLRDLFMALPEHLFRVDLSSTEIRKLQSASSTA